jgi:hypothetical protein
VEENLESELFQWQASDSGAVEDSLDSMVAEAVRLEGFLETREEAARRREAAAAKRERDAVNLKPLMSETSTNSESKFRIRNHDRRSENSNSN